MKIASNLERIGDYAKNMAKRTTVLAQMTPITGATASLRRMAAKPNACCATCWTRIFSATRTSPAR